MAVIAFLTFTLIVLPILAVRAGADTWQRNVHNWSWSPCWSRRAGRPPTRPQARRDQLFPPSPRRRPHPPASGRRQGGAGL